MCGICGIWGKADSDTIAPMVTAMLHRGPDDHGVYSDGKVGLGMARLAIIDVSPNGHQPMANREQSIWIVYNGEIYNFRAERALLESKGYKFSSSSDTEVVLRLYEHYGDDFLLRLRGMFALAIYDKRRGPGQERLLLARDHLGIKPLLYAYVDGRLVFASELKALLASGLVRREIDPVALRLLLTFGSVYQPHTMVRGVRMLLPGHRLIIENGGQRIERFWSLAIDRIPGLRTAPYDAQVEQVAHALRESVRLQLVSDVPLGAFLSGGVDSSILVAMMARDLGRRVKTFSVGFEEEGASIDETGDAFRTATFLETDHTHVVVKGSEVADRISHIAAALDQPSVDGVNSYFVSMAAREAVTVAISGTGGDEIFAGYPWFIQMALYRRAVAREPYWKRTVKSAMAHALRHPFLDSAFAGDRKSRLRFLRNAYGFLPRYADCYRIFAPAEVGALISPELREHANVDTSVVHDLQPLDELSDGSTFERVSALCLRGYTNNQLLRDIDAASMAHSLEVRVPFLDTVVVNTALSLPDSTKVSNLNSNYSPQNTTYRESGAKRILIDVGRSFLPKDFDLQPKRGFAMPFDIWLKGPLVDVLEDTLSASTIRKRGLLDADAVQGVKAHFLEGHSSWVNPWLLMMLELWCREVLDGKDSCNSNSCSNSDSLAQMEAFPSSSMAQAGS